jgi:hypothetical protein
MEDFRNLKDFGNLASILCPKLAGSLYNIFFWLKKQIKMNKRLVLGLFISVVVLMRCVVMENKYAALPPGKWRAVLKLEPEFISPNPKGKPLPDKVNMTYEDVKENELPFTFEVIYDTDTSFHIEILNGEERIVVPSSDIRFGRSKNRSRDTLRIDFPVYESYIRASYAGHIIDGAWVVTTKENYTIPFTAWQGKDYRFTPLRNQPVLDLTGKWAATFGLDEESKKTYPAIAEFKQTGNQLTGTFRTETGDYQYLEGTVQADQFYLSYFDGSHAFLFHGKILPDSSLTGAFFSGKHERTIWEARRDANAKLQTK